MSLQRTRRLGRTALDLPVYGLGTAPIGDLFTRLDDADAEQILARAWDLGVRYFDTAPWYGRGQSEHRVGRFLYRRPRHEFILSTKVGRRFFRPGRPDRFDTGFWKGGLHFDHVHDYGHDGIIRSYEDSLQRLGINTVDLLLIHDLDLGYFKTEELLNGHLAQLEHGGFRALEELKASGAIAGIGAGINECGMINRFLDRYPLDFFLVASRYTLLEQDIYPEELQRCRREGVGIIIGGVYNSGILATGPIEGAHYDYGNAPDAVIERVRRLDVVCRSHGVPLPAAALQFPLGLEIVASIIPGAASAAEVEQNNAMSRYAIPLSLWSDLKSEGLILSDVPTLS
jgi:D-threo-aldose 1-dehydrogenase